MEARFRNDAEKGVRLSISVGTRLLRTNDVHLWLESDIWTPYLKGVIEIDTSSGAIGDLRDFVVGRDVIVALTGGQDFQEAYKLTFALTDVSVEESHLRTVGGRVRLHMVSRWAYHEKGLPSKAYTQVENVGDVIEAEFNDIGVNGMVDSWQDPVPLERQRSFYRTQGPMHFLQERVLPWIQSPDDTSYFWYSTLDGRMHLHSAKDMFAQNTKAFLGPAWTVYAYDEDIPGFAFVGRSYKVNPDRTDLFHIKGSFYAEGEKESFLDDLSQDREGVAAQIQRDPGYDEIEVWYIGHRSEQEMRANAAFLRRNHLFHQTHVMLFENLELATFIRTGSIVRVYDFNTYVPEPGDTTTEELVTSNMTSEYVVIASHYIFNALDEDDGFRGTKLEVAKLGYDPAAWEGIDDVSAYMEV